MLTLDPLTDIIAQGEPLDGQFKSDRHIMAVYGLAVDGIVAMEGGRYE